MEGVHNYRENGAQVQLQIFPVSPAQHTPKLGFPDIFLVKKGSALYTSARYTWKITVVSKLICIKLFVIN